MYLLGGGYSHTNPPSKKRILINLTVTQQLMELATLVTVVINFMRIVNYIGIPLVLYFVIAHPAIIYYNTHQNQDLSQKNAVLAIIYLAIAVVGWLSVMGYGWIKIGKFTFGLRNGIRKLSQKGVLVNAKVIKSTTKKTVVGSYKEKEIEVSFDNFNKTPIRYPLILKDAKPPFNRYETGNAIQLRVDKELKYRPFVIPNGTKIKLNYQRTILLFSLWALICLGIVSYFLYAYTRESQGYGWRFLGIMHPLIFSLITLLGFALLYFLVLDKLFFSKLKPISGKKGIRLLFYGKKATATILEVSQTGTYINEQPEVSFKLTFKDSKGRDHRTSLKKVIPMIDLPLVRQDQRTIIYLPEHPEILIFEDDLM